MLRLTLGSARAAATVATPARDTAMGDVPPSVTGVGTVMRFMVVVITWLDGSRDVGGTFGTTDARSSIRSGADGIPDKDPGSIEGSIIDDDTQRHGRGVSGPREEAPRHRAASMPSAAGSFPSSVLFSFWIMIRSSLSAL